MRAIASLATLICAAACGPGAGDPGDGDGGSTGDTIEIVPADAVLEVVNGSIPEQPYLATLVREDGTREDVTAQALFTLDDVGVAEFDGATLRPTGIRGGRTTVRAQASGATGQTPVTVRIRTVRVVDPAPPNAPDLFGAATEDPARAPSIVYPSDRTLVPPNLGELEVHWADAAGNDLFEVSLVSPVVDLRVYLAPGGDPASRWTIFTPAEWALARESSRGGTLRATVRGLSSAAPQTAGSSTSIAISVGLEDLAGGIYYWAASASGIYRHDFGQPGTSPQPFYTPSESGGRCVACHALSRDGTKMAVTFDGGDGAATVLDVATRTPLFPGDGSVRSNFTVFNPDGTRMLMTSGGTITLRDPATAAVLQIAPTGGYATHPDWSPAGSRIVYVMPSAPGADWVFGGGRLVTQGIDPATDTFGAQTELVPPGAQNVYYPTFAPDGQWVLFNRSTEDAYDDGTAEIWVVKTDGSLPPSLLSTPNVGVGLTNSWARWAPFVQSTGGEIAEPLFWFTFSSKRAFGVRLGAGRPQIWMAPFFPLRAAAGTDASLPAFRLPVQDLGTSNHIAQWTEVVVPIE